MDGASDALQLRMNRSFGYVGSGLDRWRSSMIWWMVGTAVYQVALYLIMSDQKVEAEKRPADGRVTEAPAPKELSNPASRPWTWNRGRTMTVESDSVSL